MSGRKFFLIWTLTFGAIGIAVPLLLIFRFTVFQSSFGSFEFLLWPSSIMFMALDVPAPAARSTVITVYLIAIAENALLYSVIGAISWPLAYAIRKTLSHRQST